MSADRDLIAALEQALEREPEQIALRLHLAQLLLEDGQASEALRHARHALDAGPANADALRIALFAAEAVGDEVAADRYRAASAELDDSSPEAAQDRAIAAEVEAFISNTLNPGHEVEIAGVTLNDVGGLGDVKQQLERSFLGPLRNPELRQMYGKSLRGGLLLYGPPGCGKTFLARALAGEVGASFLPVGLHDVLDIWVRSPEQRVRDVFEAARAGAPCVVFLDELDAIGHKRAQVGIGGTGMRNVVTQLLSELDGVDSDNEGIFVLGATNVPWDVDLALRRPGRFDRTVLVLPPDRTARLRILEVHLQGRPTRDLRLDKVAKSTEGFSGADLRLVCDTAAEYAFEHSLHQGHVRPIEMRDVQRALGNVRPSTQPWFDVARNVVTFANSSGEYDELLRYMRQRRLL